MSLRTLFLSAALVAASAGPAASQPITPALILQAEDHLAYAGVLMIDGKQKVRVTQSDGEHQRQEFLDPKGQVRDVLVSNGQVRWHYTPKSALVRVLPVEPHIALKRRLELLSANYDFQVLGQARRANRPVVLARFYPRHKGNLTHMLWVDHETSLPLAVERREDNGTLVDRSEFSQIRFNPTVDPLLFRFRIPPGCRVASTVTVLARGDESTPLPRGLAFHARLPETLPDGYALSSWQYFRSGREVPTLNWRFHDGLNSLSLFAVSRRHAPPLPRDAQTVRFKGGTGHLLSQGSEHMLVWAAGDTSYSLVGHLPTEELEKVAASTLR